MIMGEYRKNDRWRSKTLANHKPTETAFMIARIVSPIRNYSHNSVFKILQTVSLFLNMDETPLEASFDCKFSPISNNSFSNRF